MIDIDAMVDRWTESLAPDFGFDEMFCCAQCKEDFDARYEETCVIDIENELYFCCIGCKREWVNKYNFGE